MNTLPFKNRRSGFSLVEILMVVAVVSTVSAMAVVAMSGFTVATSQTRLSRDVATINSAISAYIVSGGKFTTAELASPTAVLNRLKKRANASSQKQLAGLRGAMIDPRLIMVNLTGAEAATSVTRAVWVASASNPRFVVANNGSGGVKEFVFDPALARVDFGTETRTGTQKLAMVDNWVWDFADSGAPPSPGATSPAPGIDPTLVDPTAPAMAVLTPPTFSMPGSRYPLGSYPRSVTLSNTNSDTVSQVVYSINGGPFTGVSGPVSVDPGMTLTAMAASTNPDTHEDSTTVQETYETTPVTPLVRLEFAESDYTWFELGGPEATGPGVPTSALGLGSITNLSAIPTRYQSNTYFNLFWTVSTSSTAGNPLTDAAALAGPAFSGGFSPVTIPVDYSSFGTGNTVYVKAAVKTANPGVVGNSAVMSKIISAKPMQLERPLIEFTDRDVTITSDTARGPVPKDCRIYYTTNLMDPGDNSGEPVSGTLYTGTFTLSGATGASVTVTARVYPPLAAKQWFTTSRERARSLNLPPPVDLYVGGDFQSPSGNPMRNIARLTGSGRLDTSFNTGLGASPDSLVGVIQQSGAGVIAGGDFSTINGVSRPGLTMLNSDGSVNTSFDAKLQ